MPSGAELDNVRSFLFGVLDGFGQEDKKMWRRFWKRLIGAEPGEMVTVETVFPRNPLFHKKMFALLNTGFEAWEPARSRYHYDGRPIEKNFDRFREQVLIMAGYYKQVFSLRGDRMEFVADSISFANMDQPEFETLYSAVIDVLLREVCTRYAGRAELEAVADKFMGFA